MRHGRLDLETLALLPSWECDIACTHCVFSSSPKRKGRLPLDTVANLISDVSELTNVKRVTVSGGESFLDPQYLLSVGRIVKEHGLLFRVVTNGNFAVDEEETARLLEEVRDLNLENLCISWDLFHAHFVDPTRVRRVIRVSRRLGIPVRLTVVVTRSKRLQESLDLLEDEAFELPVTQVRCLPVGRAAKHVQRGDLLAVPPHETSRACRNDFDTFAVTADGSLYPCCAVGGFSEGIKLGNVCDTAFEELLGSFTGEMKWRTLSDKGPRFLIARATEEERERFGFDPFAHDCVNCNRLFSTGLGDELIERTIAEARRDAEALVQRFVKGQGADAISQE